MYKIIGADHREYGPVTTEQLISWIEQGRANAATPLQAEGTTEWKPLSSFPEFQAALNAKAAPAHESPAVGFYPEQILERDYHLDIGAAISSGIELLKRDFSIVFSVTAVFLALELGIFIFSSIPFIGIVISLASVLVQGPLLAGVYMTLLRRIRKEPADVAMVFGGFNNRAGQYILGHIIPGLLSLVACLPGIIMFVIGIVLTTQNTLVVGVPLLMVGGLLLFVVAMYFGICWAFTLPLVADKKIDFWSAMQLSRAMVMKHFWAVAGLVFLIVVITGLGLVVCGVGLFVTMPVTTAAFLYAFETVFGSQPSPSVPPSQSAS